MLVYSEAILSDVDEIVNIVNLAYSTAPDAPGWAGERSFQPGDRTSSREVADVISGTDSVVLVGRLDRRVISCCSVTRRDDTAVVGLFAVHPDHQSGGTGRATMDAAETLALSSFRAERLRIQVMEHHDPLRNWYMRLGYVPTGSRSPFPASIAPEPVWLVEMEKPLCSDGRM